MHLDTTLDVAEAQAGALRLDRSPVDLSAVVRQIVDLYQPAMDERHHELIVDLEDHVVLDADWGLLNRVLSNLIENEIAHLPIGCQIIDSGGSHEGSAELMIEDNGPGFPPEIRARAFERFVRGKALTWAWTGTCFRGCGGSGTRRHQNLHQSCRVAPSLRFRCLQLFYTLHET